MSTRILHISDLHFGPPFVPAVAEALLQTLPSLAPDVIVASGDLTQRATREQFQECRQFFDRLPDIPLLVIPGNHDVPLYRTVERLFTDWSLWPLRIALAFTALTNLEALGITIISPAWRADVTSVYHAWRDNKVA